MNLPPGFEHTQRAIDALRQDGAWILEEASGHIWCEERSTLKAMGVWRSRGGNLAEVKRRVAEMPRRLMVVQGDRVRPWALEQLATIPDEALVVCNRRRSAYLWIEWGQIAGHLGIFSRHPAIVAWEVWFCTEFAPAVFRHGYYNPATNHDPPPSKLLDAIERREQGRDLMNQLAPGLGHWLAGSE